LLFKPRPPAVAIVEAEHFVFVSTGFFVSGNNSHKFLFFFCSYVFIILLNNSNVALLKFLWRWTGVQAYVGD